MHILGVNGEGKSRDNGLTQVNLETGHFLKMCVFVYSCAYMHAHCGVHSFFNGHHQDLYSVKLDPQKI